mgnify:CR=1 FL=1
MKVAALQMVSGLMVEDNLNAAEILINQAADLGAELVSVGTCARIW